MTNRFPRSFRGKAIRDFIPDTLIEEATPVAFRLANGSRASGYRAEALPAICEVYLSAREAGALPANQQRIASAAEILVRGLARVGIIALVDEATGFQEIRTRDALSRILEAFIAKELQPWVSTFPPDFYREMFRLRKLPYNADSMQTPRYFGHLTNDIVYNRLAPGVLEELRKSRRRGSTGKPATKLFQGLTDNVGYPKLREHLGSVVTLMKLSNEWSDFMSKLNVIHPQVNMPPAMWSDDETLETRLD